MDIQIGNAKIQPAVDGDVFRSLGAITIAGTPLRNTALRFLPWFDTYEGEVFRRFVEPRVVLADGGAVIHVTAVSDPDVMLRERRDSSGDVCLRERSWDAEPVTACFRICLAPVDTEVDGFSFTGFKYWFECDSPDAPVHRLFDRQTWEVGGQLDDVNLVCRNWLTPPRVRLEKNSEYSTVGLDSWATLLPGNLWARWSLLPSFDMQYGRSGVLLGWFDRTSLIRTVISKQAGEDCIRFVDVHYFEQGPTFATNPKTIVWSPTVLDHTDALNLWTRLQDREHERVSREYGIPPEEPAPIIVHHDEWRNIDFETSYDGALEVCAELGGDCIFIDSIWENGEAFRRELADNLPQDMLPGSTAAKFHHENTCCTYDYAVAKAHGGEAGLRRLCDRASAKGIRVLSWFAAHMSPKSSVLFQQELAGGGGQAFAVKESGRHPDTGYPNNCWTLNLNAPVFAYMKKRIADVCSRTGLAGFLWDSVSNLGWWQLDYAAGTLRPQFDRFLELYAYLRNMGLYLRPESLATFSGSSCCGLHCGNIYEGDLLGYSGNSSIGLWYADTATGPAALEPIEAKDHALDILRGKRPFDELFRCFSHRRIPTCNFHLVPRNEWDAQAVAQIKALFRVYRKVRVHMVRRTVLRDEAGVLWDAPDGGQVFFAYQDQPARPGSWMEADTDTPVAAFSAQTVYYAPMT